MKKFSLSSPRMTLAAAAVGATAALCVNPSDAGAQGKTWGVDVDVRAGWPKGRSAEGELRQAARDRIRKVLDGWTGARRRPSSPRTPQTFPIPRPQPVPPARREPDVVANAPGSDRSCLDSLRSAGVPFRPSGALKGVKTPIEITGPIAGVRIIPRAGRPPIMDCELAKALLDGSPVFRHLGVTGLSFSGTYVYRNVAGTSKLSAHANALAIDVHALETTMGKIDVLRDYPRDGGSWGHRGRSAGSVAGCVGRPPSAAGRLLRQLACELAAHRSFNLIIGPDDNAAHRNHLHLEAHPSRPTDLYSSKPSVVHRGHRHSRR